MKAFRAVLIMGGLFALMTSMKSDAAEVNDFGRMLAMCDCQARGLGPNCQPLTPATVQEQMARGGNPGVMGHGAPQPMGFMPQQQPMMPQQPMQPGFRQGGTF